MTLPLGFAKGFDLRLGADFRRIAFAFTPKLNPMNGRIAGGAVDQYIGVNVGVGYTSTSERRLAPGGRRDATYTSRPGAGTDRSGARRWV